MPKLPLVEFTRCPYDAAVIEVEPDPSGSTRLSCSKCGAAWEWNRAGLRRVAEPDRAVVRAARAANQPPEVIRGTPNRELATAMWRQVRAASPGTNSRSGS